MVAFPNQLTIRVVDARSKQPVPNVALKLMLFAPRKNNYTIPAVTGASGEVRLSVDDVRRSIEDDWRLFPMDYVSSLEECSPEVDVKVCSTEDVRRAIDAMKMFKSATSTISDELIRGFQNSVNGRFTAGVKRLNVEQTDAVELSIVPAA